LPEPGRSSYRRLPAFALAAQAEEAGAIPTGAGDGASDLRQALIGAAVPGIAVDLRHHPMELALPISNQHGTRLDRITVSQWHTSRQPLSPLPRHPIKQPCRRRIEIAEAFGLDPNERASTARDDRGVECPLPRLSLSKQIVRFRPINARP
jgi:hypothetical protein